MTLTFNGKTLLFIEPGFHETDNSFLWQMLDAWLDARTKLDNGECTSEMYEDWQRKYPFTAPEASDRSDENTDSSTLEETKKPKQKRGRKPKKKD